MKHAIGLAAFYLVLYIIVEIIVASTGVSYKIAGALVVLPLTAIVITVIVMNTNNKKQK